MQTHQWQIENGGTGKHRSPLTNLPLNSYAIRVAQGTAMKASPTLRVIPAQLAAWITPSLGCYYCTTVKILILPSLKNSTSRMDSFSDKECREKVLPKYYTHWNHSSIKPSRYCKRQPAIPIWIPSRKVRRTGLRWRSERQHFTGENQATTKAATRDSSPEVDFDVFVHVRPQRKKFAYHSTQPERTKFEVTIGLDGQSYLEVTTMQEFIGKNQ